MTLHPINEALRPCFAWVGGPSPAGRVVAALEAARPGSARFVGGCVRDSLLGQIPKDIDIATPLLPEVVVAALRTAGLGFALTGLDHGTVTAIADGAGIEITSLRADVSTDGRRATVAFCEDWRVDASRRDFTINALYLTPLLELYDPLCGLADLHARRVRFIGEPADRIREDYLRILRFFRFSARFSDGAFDAAGLAACEALRGGLAQLSAERIGGEFCRILELPAPGPALRAMAATGVLSEIWPATPDLNALDRLSSGRPGAPAALGLAALWGQAGQGLGPRLRLSNAVDARRGAAASNAPLVADLKDDRAARALLFHLGAEPFADAAYLVGDEVWTRFAATHAPPVFALSGRDVLALGVSPGPPVAGILQAVQARWIEEDFPPPDRQRAILTEVVAAKASHPQSETGRSL